MKTRRSVDISLLEILYVNLIIHEITEFQQSVICSKFILSFWV